MQSDSCWVLLSFLMELWALEARMGNCMFNMGSGERMSLFGKFVMLLVAQGAVSISAWEFLNAHNPDVNVV